MAGAVAGSLRTTGWLVQLQGRRCIQVCRGLCRESSDGDCREKLARQLLFRKERVGGHGGPQIIEAGDNGESVEKR